MASLRRTPRESPGIEQSRRLLGELLRIRPLLRPPLRERGRILGGMAGSGMANLTPSPSHPRGVGRLEERAAILERAAVAFRHIKNSY